MYVQDTGAVVTYLMNTREAYSLDEYQYLGRNCCWRILWIPQWNDDNDDDDHDDDDDDDVVYGGRSCAMLY